MTDLQIFDVEQGGDAWRQARLGIPTASMFSAVLAKGEGKTRNEYMRKLAGERITGEPMETYSNHHMERGKAMEDEARQLYAFRTGAQVSRVGFMRRANIGCSPDSLVVAVEPARSEGLLEIKTALPHIQIERLERGTLPAEHRPQVQGGLLVSGLPWCDFVSYWPRLPQLIVRVYRDEEYLKALESELARFNADLDALEAKIRGME